jgi:hypothetical protein
VHAFCTHVVANQPFFDLSQESLNESTELVAFIRNKTSGNDTIFVMGDFNIGPEIQLDNEEDIHSTFPDSYWYIRNSNFSDSQWLYDNITGTPVECTYCEANPLTSVVTQDQLIDHIFISNSSNICVQLIEIFAKENL